ncbi:hypothetical protein BT93_C0119 [Corymbia citriodora subsp. variegata]|nr:hypothetical protein BT93_C0119 [Corymbia citriodora subsp. variegata]
MEDDGSDSSDALQTDDELEESDSEEERLRDLQEFRVARLGELRGSAAGGSRLEAPSRCASSHAIPASREEPEERAKQFCGELGSDIKGEGAETYSRIPRAVCPSISSGLSLFSVSQSISSVASSTPLDRKLPPATEVTDSCTVRAKKVRDGRQRSQVKSARIIAESEVVEHPVRMLPESDPSVASSEQKNESPSSISEREIEKVNGFDANDGIVAKQENDNNPEPKPRGKKNRLLRSSSPSKPGKKPKYVVHAAGDVGISADGYRWRKYGQKMVKGNPYPRNYYRCTSAGCPVRKQVETAIDNASAVKITYKGIHDHDKPVPKKRHGPQSVPLITAASPDSLHSTPIKKSDGLRDHTSPTQWSMDSDGELSSQALDLGGEKAIESARTLLSIGFEIKPR